MEITASPSNLLGPPSDYLSHVILYYIIKPTYVWLMFVILWRILFLNYVYFCWLTSRITLLGLVSFECVRALPCRLRVAQSVSQMVSKVSLIS